MTVVMPVAVAVNATEHVPAASVQVGVLSVPADVKETVPVGVPTVDVTVAVQVETCPTTTGVVHATVVVVVAPPAVTVAVPEPVA